MRRREFITLLGGVAAAWPLAARAQQQSVPVIGFLRSTTLLPFEHLNVAFRQGLKEAGLVEGQDVVVEYRYADNQPDRLQAMAAELVKRPVAVIVTNASSAQAIKNATSTIPIVFAGGGDPVRQGLVISINRPGGNITGVNFFAGQMGSKRLELLLQLVPKVSVLGMIIQPNTTETESERKDLQQAAQTIGRRLVIVDVNNDRDIEAAFASLVQQGVGALIVSAGAFLTSKRDLLIALSARHSLPASYGQREFGRAGALMTYGTSQGDAYRQVGIYAARILKGEKPADLPVMQSTKFEFVINLKTAKALGLEVPDRLLALADEVIE